MDLYSYFSSANGSTNLVKKDNSNFPISFDYIWILGKKYHALHDIENLRKTVHGKVWFSYRKDFWKIGGTGPHSDKYWGCMMRCGQMVLAEALIYRHLGRDWLWEKSCDSVYEYILKMFQDRKNCSYSIHQIAQMGVSEGKAIGDWFGPNTISHVIRKLCAYDEWSNLAVHVANYNTVILDDIKAVCTYQPKPPTSSPPASLDFTTHACPGVSSRASHGCPVWRPMLLFIPLRLGLSEFDKGYTKSVKEVFKIKQSLGLLGGTPRHAMWCIGVTGEEIICMDPHSTHQTVNLDEKFDDSSFHIQYEDTTRMKIVDMDPSIALCFYFDSKEDFDDWCQQISQILNVPENQFFFELMQTRPAEWPPLELQPDLNSSINSADYVFLDGCHMSEEEEFEKIDAGAT